MTDITAVGARLKNLEVSPQFSNYSKVVIHVDDENDIIVGDDTGKTLEVVNPFGTQQMAAAMLTKLRGYQYQPYNAEDARLNPAAELGDGVTMRGNYGGLYSRYRSFGRLMKANISAPKEEEINHEYKFESPTERTFSRQMAAVKASLIVQSNQILAQVVKQQDGSTSSFGWNLNSSGWQVFSNGKTVISASQGGLDIKGRITAESGYIGSESSGFNISAKAIYNGVTSMTDTAHDGVYVGTDGIRLGKGNFSVTTSGSLTAKSAQLENATISGTLIVGGKQISANNLYTGASQANSNYSKWNGTSTTVSNGSGTWNNTSTYVGNNGSLWDSTHISVSNNGSYWTSGAGFGFNFNYATVYGTSNYPAYFKAGSMVASWYTANSGVITPAIQLAGHTVYCSTLYIDGTSYNVVRWR